jgi:hypothetical protein
MLTPIELCRFAARDPIQPFVQLSPLARSWNLIPIFYLSIYLSIFLSIYLSIFCFFKTSLLFGFDNAKNEAVMRDFLQKWRV